MSKLDTLKSLSGLQLAYSKDLSEERMDFYVEMLQDIPAQTLSDVVKIIIQTSRFLPTIAEIREKAIEGTKIMMGTKEPDPDEAWGMVQKAIMRIGQYSHPDFGTPILQETVDHMGWKDICQTPADDTGILRAQFRRAYEQALNRQKTKEAYRAVGIIAPSESIKAVESCIRPLAQKMSMDR